MKPIGYCKVAWRDTRRRKTHHRLFFFSDGATFGAAYDAALKSVYELHPTLRMVDALTIRLSVWAPAAAGPWSSLPAVGDYSESRAKKEAA